MAETDARVPREGGPGEPTRSTLLARVRALDPAAWDRLVALYGPLVYRWARAAGLQEADAADAGQEVFRAVAGSIGEFRRDRPGDTFRGWLRVITRNKVADLVRRRPPGGQGVGGTDACDRLAQMPGADADADPDEPDRAVADELEVYRRAVELVLADFAPDTRAAFLRVVVGGEEPAAVAADLGISRNAVYLAKARVKRRLQDEFGELLDL